MKKVGEFWLPDVDLQIWRRFGKTRRKTIERFTGGGPKLNDLQEVLALIPAGRVAIDGGANVGAYARILAAHFDVVHAFEPAPDTFAALQRNIQEWGLTGRVILHNKALAERVDSVALSLKRGGRSVSRTISGPGDLPAISIDSLALDGVDLIKLDVEGYEFQALSGAAETLRRCRPAVMFEDKPGKRDPAAEAQNPHDYLQALGARRVGKFGQGEFDWLYVFD